MAAIIAGAPQAVAPGGYYVQGGGTSASSPVVAGTGALWLERFPNATWQEYREAVMWCAKRDTFTGNNLPNNDWGYGKLDAFSMMVNCAQNMSVSTPSAITPQMAIFPVPANAENSLTIQLGIWDAQSAVTIYNAAGQLVFSALCDANGRVTVPAGLLSTGMYTAVSTGMPSTRFIVD
jgi:hypothetical protein